MHKALAALTLLSVATAAIAQDDDSTTLSGSLTITGKTGENPPPGEKKDRVAFFVTGAAAKRIYDAMPAKAVRDVCEDGMRVKDAGNLGCSKGADGEYICMFAIVLTNGQSKPYGSC